MSVIGRDHQSGVVSISPIHCFRVGQSVPFDSRSLRLVPRINAIGGMWSGRAADLMGPWSLPHPYFAIPNLGLLARQTLAVRTALVV